MKPSWPIFEKTSRGNSRAASHSSACGASSLRQKSRTAFRNMSCSSVNWGCFLMRRLRRGCEYVLRWSQFRSAPRPGQGPSGQRGAVWQDLFEHVGHGEEGDLLVALPKSGGERADKAPEYLVGQITVLFHQLEQRVAFDHAQVAGASGDRMSAAQGLFMQQRHLAEVRPDF